MSLHVSSSKTNGHEVNVEIQRLGGVKKLRLEERVRSRSHRNACGETEKLHL